MGRFTIIRCRKIQRDLAEFDVRWLSGEIREGHTFSFQSVYDRKEFKVVSIRACPEFTTLVCAGALDYDNELTRTTLDTVPTLAEQPIRPLPPDVAERVRLVFPDAVEAVEQRLTELRHEGVRFVGDRIIRGIVWCAWRYPEISLEKWIELAQLDYRDLIVAAEYARDDWHKQLRDFVVPFRDEDFSANDRPA